MDLSRNKVGKVIMGILTYKDRITKNFLPLDETMKQFIPEIENNFSERDCEELLVWP